jgi:hypothetical protein
MMQSSQGYELQPAQPQAAAIFGAMANFQSKISELEKRLQSHSAVEQLLRERAEKPLQNEELWVKIAKALCTTFSPWGVTCFVPLDRDRGLISMTLLLALIKDCFITRELLHKLFEPMKKPTEHQIYSILLPVKYQTVKEAMDDLYVMERFQVEHAMSLPFQPSAETLDDMFKALATFIKQSPHLADPPHIRLEQAGSRSDITQEYIGKPLGPQSLARWGEYIGGNQSHFRVEGAIFAPISQPELDTFHSAPFTERESEPAPHYTFGAYQPAYHHPQPHFQPEILQPRFHEDYRPSTVQVSEVSPAATACERYIAAEGVEAFKQLQRDFPEERFSLLSDKEFKAIARKHVAALKKRKREPEKPKSKPRKRAEKKSSRKKSKKVEEEEEEVQAEEDAEDDE